jgi:hypothetical protein
MDRCVVRLHSEWRKYFQQKKQTTAKDNSEIQGSLHCATDGEAVRRFGLDDVFFLVLSPDRPLFASPERLRLAQKLGGVLGEVGDDEVGAGAADAEERLEHGALGLEPAALEGGVEHGVLAGDLIGAEG